jgi:NtrC-family two-component system response regulator AlgB
MVPLRVLVVDDEANIRKTLAISLESEGHAVTAVGNVDDAVAEISRQPFDLAFVDLRLGTASGLDLIPALLGVTPSLKIVVITAYASIDTAVEAMRRGATDYIPKPFTPAQVNLAVAKVAEVRALERRVRVLQEDLDRINPEMDFSTASAAMRRTLDLAHQVARSEAVVLLRGENGTGKSVLARAMHGWSQRAEKPFAVVSCPALPADLLESELFGHVKGAFTGAVRDHAGRIAACEGGTLLLDEIGDLPSPLQPKLLRFIQEREYESVGGGMTRKADVRLMAATNVDLEQAVREGRFREDLYYRLNVVPIVVPPLRERLEDVVPLAERLLAFFGRSSHRVFLGFTDEAKAALRSHPWPGNVRELRNVVERASILCRTESVGLESLPEAMAGDAATARPGDLLSLDRLEEQHIRRVLATTRSLQEAADILGIDQATLWRRRKKYGI